VQGPPPLGPLVDMLHDDVGDEVECLPLDKATPSVDYFIPSMSILRVLAKTYGIERAMGFQSLGYIFPPVEVERDLAKVRCGIAWKGNSAHVHDRYRSTTLETLKPILDVEGCDFVCLQHGDEERREALDAGMTVCHLSDLGALAAKIAEMDIVISIDSMPAHLAGAVGVPVWMLTAANADFRWGLTGERTPWYASMRILRQKAMSNWSDPVNDAARRLDALARDGRVGAA
jgi:hypothetical protein